MADELTPAQIGGVIARQATDKAEREIRRSQYHPCTVHSFTPPSDFGPTEAVVHMDGDPTEQLQQVVVATGIELLPGQRAIVVYNPPHQAILITAIGIVKVPAFRLSDIGCTSGPMLSGGRVDFCCDEIHIAGTENVTTSGISSGHIVAGGLWEAAVTGSWSIEPSDDEPDPPEVTLMLWLYDSGHNQQRLIAQQHVRGFSGALSLPCDAFIAETGQYVGFEVALSYPNGIVFRDLVLTGTRLGPADDWDECGGDSLITSNGDCGATIVFAPGAAPATTITSMFMTVTAPLGFDASVELQINTVTVHTITLPTGDLTVTDPLSISLGAGDEVLFVAGGFGLENTVGITITAPGYDATLAAGGCG